MANFASFTKDILQSKTEYFRQPKMLQDMLQVQANLRDFKEFKQYRMNILIEIAQFWNEKCDQMWD